MFEEKPKKRIWDKLLMGAIIGGAIGSVVGASIAPKKGKETRKEIIQAVKDTGKGSKKIFQKIKNMFSFWKKDKTNKTQPPGQPSIKVEPNENHKRAQLKKIPHEEIVEIEQ